MTATQPVHDALFDLGDLETAPHEDPKSMRRILIEGLAMQLQADADDLDPGFDEAEWTRDADSPLRSGSAYWEHYQQARGIRLALSTVRRRLETHEEYLAADAERRRRTWTEAELACARHRDVCPHCTSHTQAMWRARRREDHQEKIRSIYVQGIHRVLVALDDPERTLTLKEVRKALQSVQGAAHKVWSSAEAPA